MLKLNQELLLTKRKELTEFEGWVPFALDNYFSYAERREYLKSIGLYREIEETNQTYKRLLRMHPEPQLFMEELVREFVEKNPEFEGIIIE